MTAPADLNDGNVRPVSRLSAPGVKSMLRRRGVDYSALTITEDSTVWTDVDTGHRSTSVVISGPAGARGEAWVALIDAGLKCAPYPSHDDYSRPAR